MTQLSDLGEAKIKVTLEIGEAKRQIEDLRKAILSVRGGGTTDRAIGHGHYNKGPAVSSPFASSPMLSMGPAGTPQPPSSSGASNSSSGTGASGAPGVPQPPPGLSGTSPPSTGGGVVPPYILTPRVPPPSGPVGPGGPNTPSGLPPAGPQGNQGPPPGQMSPRPPMTASQRYGGSWMGYGLGQLNFSSPLDFGISALNAIPEVGGALALSAKAIREASEVGLPIAKGIIKGLSVSVDNPLAKTMVQAAIQAIDTVSDAMTKTEAWNESIRPSILSSLQMAKLAGAMGIPVSAPMVTDYALQTYDVAYAENALNRKFRKWQLENSGEAVGAGLEDALKQSFSR